MAGIAIAIEADETLSEALKANFESFLDFAGPDAASSPGGKASIRWDDCVARWHRNDGAEGRLRVADPTFRLGATQLLLNDALAALLPRTIALHGNALLDSGGRLLVLLGESGAGKTTLTRELLRLGAPADSRSTSWRLLCEDLILLDTERASIWPYPRAAGLRDFASAAEVASRTGFGQGAPAKAIVAYTEAERHAGSEPLPLGSVDVVLMTFDSDMPALRASADRQGAASAPSPRETEAYLTWAEATLPQRLARRGLEGAVLEERAGIFHLSLPRALTADALAILAEEAGVEGGVLLLVQEVASHESEPSSRPTAPRRPAQPRLDVLSAGDAVPRLLRHVRRGFTTATRPGAAARTLFDLARTLGRARFHLFVPGGSPGDSARILHTLGPGDSSTATPAP